MSQPFQFSLGALLGIAGLVAVGVWQWQTYEEFGLMPDRSHQLVRAIVRNCAILWRHSSLVASFGKAEPSETSVP